MSEPRRLISGPVRAVKTIAALPLAAVAAAAGIGIAKGIDDAIKQMNVEMAIEEAKRNHAGFEGTWTPFDMRVLKEERRQVAWDQSINNHAETEGAHFQPYQGAA